jgi:AcrR family transcriptional regulator
MNKPLERKRPYRQAARAEAAEATATRILDAFAARLKAGWFDEIRLEDVAGDAGVSVQTVIRRFGGKEGLLPAMHARLNAEIDSRREVSPGDIQGAIRVLTQDYEAVGDLVLRTLAQEDRHPVLRQMTDTGRAFHRRWVARVFAPALAPLPPGLAEHRLDALVVATDLYVWKLLRRDMRRSERAYQAHVKSLVTAALAANLPET